MHWPDPDQRLRIVEIRDNLIARIAEAVVVDQADPDLLAGHVLVVHPVDQVFDWIERRGWLADCPSPHGCGTWLASARGGFDEVFADGVPVHDVGAGQPH